MATTEDILNLLRQLGDTRQAKGKMQYEAGRYQGEALGKVGDSFNEMVDTWVARGEAGKKRDFDAEQAQLGRDFEAGEAGKERAFKTSEREGTQTFQTGPAVEAQLKLLDAEYKQKGNMQTVDLEAAKQRLEAELLSKGNISAAELQAAMDRLVYEWEQRLKLGNADNLTAIKIAGMRTGSEVGDKGSSVAEAYSLLKSAGRNLNLLAPNEADEDGFGPDLERMRSPENKANILANTKNQLDAFVSSGKMDKNTADIIYKNVIMALETGSMPVPGEGANKTPTSVNPRVGGVAGSEIERLAKSFMSPASKIWSNFTDVVKSGDEASIESAKNTVLQNAQNVSLPPDAKKIYLDRILAEMQRLRPATGATQGAQSGMGAMRALN